MEQSKFKYTSDFVEYLERVELQRDTFKRAYLLEKDKNEQLKVEVEALKPYRDNHHDLMRHMAEHDAQVIENALYDLSTSFRYEFTGVYSLDGIEEFIDNYINQLRQKAQESFNDSE